MSLVPAGPVETVFRWKDAGCPADFIPDSPARAWRRPDGSAMLIAAHYGNGSFSGPSLDALQPRCRVRTGGEEDADPARFDDRFWVQALYPVPDGRLLALVSHEYMGKRHPGRCRFADAPGPRCWYSAILAATAGPDGLSFTLRPRAERVVAAPPVPYDPDRAPRTGFFTTTNIVRDGAWLYALSWAEYPGVRGNCLLRAPAATPEGPWLARRGGAFASRLPGVYDQGEPGGCDPVGTDRQLGILRSVVRIGETGPFAGVFSVANGASRPPGIYYSLSPDLVTWGEPRLLAPLRPWFGTMECQAFYDYPSLIDPQSPSPVFDVAGRTLRLYLTRFNWTSCDRGLDRDLVMLPVRVETTP
ncbi:MAG: hypothetical protein JO048_16390 [Methylobacteriaceae bacterium]|nr:hypothetical protein [Methylobacteriaceae bacterium]